MGLEKEEENLPVQYDAMDASDIDGKSSLESMPSMLPCVSACLVCSFANLYPACSEPHGSVHHQQ
jgi:hypothetical protein